MLVLETIVKMRRAYFVHGKPIKAICRELNVSRKVVRSEATEFRYERKRQPMPSMGTWRDEFPPVVTTARFGVSENAGPLIAAG